MRMDKTVRSIDPLVSTEWLAEHLQDPGLVILDIRSGGDYLAGHIPNAIQIPAGLWSTVRDFLDLELPDEDVLFYLIGCAAITDNSTVVVVHRTEDPARRTTYLLADASRVADTLIYAGIQNTAILDGGYDKWKNEGRKVSAAMILPLPASYRGEVNKGMLASREYIQEHTGKCLIIDARDPEVYFGATVEAFAPKAGHIPGAKNLPAAWIWNADGTYKKEEILRELASGIIEKDTSGEIIIYCGVGGYASTWWFVLTQMLGFRNVKLYDGSAQEWIRYYDMVKYQWE
jgi:thiosulfate/3-mercaptopyruvate sulfurtransferase